MYKREQYDRHLEAIEAASSIVSAAIAHDGEYAGRISGYLGEYGEIADLFEPDARDVRDVARAFHKLVIGVDIDGFEAMRLERIFERCIRKIKSQLRQTASMVADNRAKPSCADKANHAPGCSCKRLRLFELAHIGEQE